MITWEYCIEFVGTPTGLLSEQRLAVLGEAGWELAAVHAVKYKRTTAVIAGRLELTGSKTAIETAWIFKREKQKGEK